MKGYIIFKRTLLSRKKSHNLAWSCAISNIFYCVTLKNKFGDVNVWFTLQGIGRQLALQLSREGAKIACWDVNQKTADRTVQEIRRGQGGVAYAFTCDVSDREQVKIAAESTRW